MAAPFATVSGIDDDSSAAGEACLPGSARVMSPSVRAAEVDGLILVMDLQTSAFYFLDEDASSMWKGLRQAHGSVGAAKEALGRGNESSGRLAGAFDDFIASCEAQGFLVSSDRPPARDFRRAPWPRGSRGRSLLTVRAWLAMLRMDIALRRHGFAAIYQRLGQGGIARADSADVELVRAAFLRAENFYVRRRAPHDCLPRSLALYAYLRGLGIPVVHRIGARRFPSFGCHAWVEYGGAPILDRSAVVHEYTVIASM
ncbi:lasso peptide biosynthesis B2 protein [Mycobacterium sp.]|uniref:lasso peptide biosynthesis B2 protein n=1 Tax=Mycobacterium sp. TaxID=1785 RepID=UPI002B6DEF14|nr:lasso peptide biosynthesis B2 protein [Mycobacterium sp.]HTQ21815.1 lasso peptide biosynthesis B2 protein [Mycobacterium sp.]